MKILENKELNGLEVIFDSKPSRETLDCLKLNGFRWHRQKKLWYAHDTEKRREVLERLENGKIETRQSKPKEKKNKYGVKVGDVFVISFGYDATFYDFFQVVELVGETSVRLREIPCPGETVATGALTWEHRLKETHDIIEPSFRSQWIKDNEKGDLKRVSISSWDNQPHITIGNHWATPINWDRNYEGDNYH